MNTSESYRALPDESSADEDPQTIQLRCAYGACNACYGVLGVGGDC